MAHAQTDAWGLKVSRHGGEGFLAALENWWRAERQPAEGPVASAFDGGWAVFLGYELAQEIEPRLALPRCPLPWSAFALRTPCALVHELSHDRVWAVGEADSASAFERVVADAHAVALAQDARR